MSNLYRLERAEDYRDEDGPFYDVTKNGERISTRVRFSEAFGQVVSRIEDGDRFQEVTDGRIDCEMSGASVKEMQQ
jgi:hypothetical protein